MTASKKLCFGLAALGGLLAVVSAAVSGHMMQVGGVWIRDLTEALHHFSLQSLIHNLINSILTSPWHWLFGSVAVYLLYQAYKLFFLPLNRVRKLADIGILPEGQLTPREVANRVRRRRIAGDLLPVYPNGWFAIVESRDLKVRESKSVACLGLMLAVFRGEDGQVHIVDAYCPHLGANLAVGGRVFGDCIECPFHGWQFSGQDGRCVSIPNCKGKIPDVAKVKTYPVLERNGSVYFWYHAEGVEPYWTPPEIEEITSGDWVYRGRTEHYINAHIEEVPENGADTAHLPCVHQPLLLAGIDLRTMWAKLWQIIGHHEWEASWKRDEEPHSGTLSVTHSLRVFGYHSSLLDMNVKARQIGPGIVYLTYESQFGRGVYIHHVTPIEPMLQQVIHHVYFAWYIPPIIPKFFMVAEALMIERDIMIWNNKLSGAKPVFVKSDADQLLLTHRRWYSQFYSENSPKLSFQKDGLNW